MKNRICLTFLFLALASLVAYSAPKKKKSNKKKIVPKKEIVIEKQSTSSKPMIYCLSSTDWPSWYLTSVLNFKFPSDAVKPANYRLLNVDEPAMIQFLKTVSYDSATTKITVPLYIDNTLLCKEFSIQRVQTMDDELQAKYPELMSFKVFEPSNQLNAGRIDCDALSTKFMITYDTQVYYVTPVDYNGGKIYVAYAKNDPNFQKKPFEGRR